MSMAAMRSTTLTSVFVSTLFAAACASSERNAADAAPGESPGAEAYEASLVGHDLVDRFVQASALFLGTPYAGGPLGEGEGNSPDSDPRVDFGRADCVTYLEQTLALAIEPLFGEGRFLDALDAIRYRDSEVTFAARNHYVVRDWIPANAWLLRDVTAEVAGDRAEDVTRRIDRVAFLRGQGVEPRAGIDDVRAITIPVAPSSALRELEPNLRSGDLLFWVGKKEGIFALHSGLVVRGADGAVTFRHASSTAGRVVDESLAEYAERSTFDRGFLVLRIRTDAVAPGAKG
jgi:hypothetical protein